MSGLLKVKRSLSPALQYRRAVGIRWRREGRKWVVWHSEHPGDAIRGASKDSAVRLLCLRHHLPSLEEWRLLSGFFPGGT